MIRGDMHFPITDGLIEYTSEMMPDVAGIINAFCIEMDVDSTSVLANIDRGFTNITLSKSSGEVTGIIGWIKNDKCALGEIFYVIPQKRMTKLAYKLLKHAEKLAAFNGCQKLVTVVKKDRVELYKNRGYHNSYYVMEKTIEDL